MDGRRVRFWWRFGLYAPFSQPKALGRDLYQDVAALWRGLLDHGHAAVEHTAEIFGTHDVTHVIFTALKNRTADLVPDQKGPVSRFPNRPSAMETARTWHREGREQRAHGAAWGFVGPRG
jgi:hypothetical protein